MFQSRLPGDVRKALIASVVVLLGGCAFGTRHPTLVYPPDAYPEGSAGYVSPADAATMPATRAFAVRVRTFADVRDDKERVGTVRNGYGMRTARVVATNSVTDWVTQATVSELKSAGYASVPDDAPTDVGDGALVVSGDVVKAFCDMYMDFSAEVVLKVSVRRAGAAILTSEYRGKGNSGIAIAATSQSYAQSLALALASALRQFVNDLGRVLRAP